MWSRAAVTARMLGAERPRPPSSVGVDGAPGFDARPGDAGRFAGDHTMLLKVVGTALATGEDLVGAETRRAGQLILGASALVAMTRFGIVEPSSVPPFGLPLTGAVTTLDVLLILTIVASLAMYGLRLLADVERLTRRELVNYVARLQMEAEAETRRIQEEEVVASFDAPGMAGQGNAEARRRILRARLRSLTGELDRLRRLGEHGSRFTAFSAERAVAEAELRQVTAELQALDRDLTSAGEGVEGGPDVPPRVRWSQSYLDRLRMLDEARTRIEASALMAASQRARVTVDVLLAPLVGLGAIVLWAIGI